MKFNLKNFKTAILLFLSEVLIAQTTGFIRHTVGDYLVVILLYFLVKSFFDIPTKKLAFGIFLFSFSVEILQYFSIVKHLGLQHNKLANIIIGNTFSFTDLLAYLLGVLTILLFEPTKKSYINAYKTPY